MAKSDMKIHKRISFAQKWKIRKCTAKIGVWEKKTRQISQLNRWNTISVSSTDKHCHVTVETWTRRVCTSALSCSLSCDIYTSKNKWQKKKNGNKCIYTEFKPLTGNWPKVALITDSSRLNNQHYVVISFITLITNPQITPSILPTLPPLFHAVTAITINNKHLPGPFQTAILLLSDT